jgi:cyclopropane-fatty-acyl-phospholipid synthase
MNHSIFLGKTYHQRVFPKKHGFSYPLWYALLSISDLKDSQKITPLFGYNRFSLLSLFSSDYLSKSKANLIDKYKDLYKSHRSRPTSSPVATPAEQTKNNSVYLLSLPRLIGKQFNPVSFYLEINSQSELVRFTLEINNTFGEKHHYLLEIEDAKLDPSGFVIWKFPKTFHVSPFNLVEGEYEVQVKMEINPKIKTISNLHIKVDLYKNNLLAFRSGLFGTLKPMSDSLILKNLFSLPFQLWLVTTNIGIQAFKLYFFRTLGVYDKPEPTSENTQKWDKPVLLQRLLTGGLLEKIQRKRSS